MGDDRSDDRSEHIVRSGHEQQLGLIGHPVAHSLSPRMQQAAFDALGIRVRYALWDTLPEQLPARIAALRAPGMLGANVTIPYKAAVVPLLDEIDPQARRAAGVVNTIVSLRTETTVRLVGYNTDVVALTRILDEQARWRARRVLALGAGGAAQAAIGAARARGADIWVAARDRAKAAEALAGLWRREHEEEFADGSDTRTAVPREWSERALTFDDTARLRDALAQADVLMQTTPLGMERHDDPQASQRSPIPLEMLDYLPPHALVFDAVYAPPETALVRAARERGLRAIGGLPMLLYQGAAAFTLWTGQPAPLTVMQAALGL